MEDRRESKSKDMTRRRKSECQERNGQTNGDSHTSCTEKETHVKKMQMSSWNHQHDFASIGISFW
jgi:hypothetical protein